LAAEVTPLWVLMSTVGTERHYFGFRLQPRTLEA
jgi:hypothetical protein